MRKIACFCLLLLVMSCHKKNKVEYWNTVLIDTMLKQSDIYKKMNEEKEIENYIFGSKSYDSIPKYRSSHVELFGGGLPKEFSETRFDSGWYSDENNCRAFFQSDTLVIRIGLSSGFSSHDVFIKLFNKKFSIVGNYWFDAMLRCADSRYDSTIFQKLILDKPNYKTGDSLYGFVDFKSIQTNECKDTFLFRARGYFRVEVKHKLLPKD